MARKDSPSPEQEKAKEDKPKKPLGRPLFTYLQPYRGVFIPAMIALFTTAALSLAFPYYMGSLIGGAVGSGGTLDVEEVGKNINKVTLTLLVFLFLQAFIAFWRIGWFTKAGESAVADIRRDVYSRVIRLPMSFFGERRVGEITSRIATDLEVIRETLINTVPQLVRQAVTLIGGMAFLLISSIKLSLFMLACIPIVVLFVVIFGRRIRAFSKAAQDELAQSNVVVEESLQGISNVKAFTNEQFEEKRYGSAIDRFLDATMRGARSRAFFVSFIIFVMFGVITMVVWFGAGMLKDGAITPEQFTRFVLFSIFVGAAMGSFPEIISQLQKAGGATERTRELLAEEKEPVGPEGGAEMERLKGDVALQGVEFAYPSRKDIQVLKGIDFHAKPGERIALVGPSGSGKSTVIALLLRFYDPDKGTVSFDGKAAPDYALDFLRKQTATVPQEVLLFGGTIRENIRYGRPEATDEEIEAAAKKANAATFIEGFPEGYETMVGDRGIKLSGGQRQRVAIARAILADPSILILDEATSSLDSESERLVQEALESLMENRTSFIIAHRLSTVKTADRILVIKDGKIVESGTHAELVENQDGVYKMLSALQFEASSLS